MDGSPQMAFSLLHQKSVPGRFRRGDFAKWGWTMESQICLVRHSPGDKCFAGRLNVNRNVAVMLRHVDEAHHGTVVKVLRGRHAPGRFICPMV